MKQTLTTCSVERFIDKYNDGKINFDFAIQREAGQWTQSQKSLLIHSAIDNSFCPMLCLTEEETVDGSVWTVVDGRQRGSTFIAYLNDEFKLSPDTPEVDICGEKYKLAGLRFSELPKNLQDRIRNYSLNMVFFFELTEEKLEEQFLKLNNGSIFTKQQKATVKLGIKLAEKLNELGGHPFWERTNISNIQKVHGIVMETMLKSLMLITDYKYSHFGAAEVIKFADYYSENYNEREIEYLAELIGQLNNAIPDSKEYNEFLKPINVPMLLMNMEHFESHDLPLEVYTKFIKYWFEEGCEESEYTKYCGSGSTNVNKVWGRINTLNDSLDKFLGGEIDNGNNKISA